MLRRAALLCFLAVFAAMPILPAVTVSGIVLDSTNNPVEDVAVSLMPVPAGATSLRTHTASGGIFRFEHVEPGEYLVDVNKQGYIQSSEPGGPILNVASEQSAVPVTLRIARSASIAGRLLTQDGVPIGGASIEASCKGSRDQVTDAYGRFHFASLEPGACNLRAFLPAEFRVPLARTVGNVTFGLPESGYYQGGAERSSATPIHVGAGQDANVEFRFIPIRLASLDGSVIDSATGDLLIHAEARLEPENIFLRGRDSKRTPLSGGHFHFGLLRPGRYRMSIYRSSGPKDLPTVRNVDVPETGATELRIAIGSRTRVTGHANIRGVGDALTFTLRPEGSGVEGARAIVDSNGDFAFDGVTPGIWTLSLQQHFLPELHNRLSIARVTQGLKVLPNGRLEIIAGPNQAIEIELGEVFGVSGTIVGPDGSPIVNGVVLFHNGTSGLWHFSGSDGVFRLGSLFAGEYRVSAWPAGTDPSPSLPTGCANPRTLRVNGNVSGVIVKLCP